MDPYRPHKKTGVNFFLTGSYTQQDYIDSMEGATISGRRAARRFEDNEPQRHRGRVDVGWLSIVCKLVEAPIDLVWNCLIWSRCLIG